MTLTINFSDAGHWLVLVLIAALAGLLVELIRGGAIPLTFVGELLFALLGGWLGSDLLAARLAAPPGPVYDGVVLIPAAVGALVVGLLWGMLGGSRRRHY
jgi:uncharacterized membrane protein YeaQ/YmgE (transglycosylase-associated protein family)